MPGYLFRPDSTGAARPTVVVTNGSDGSLAGLWAYVIKGALERGWNVFVFDGPGQQSMLFERDVPFRHDWEAVAHSGRRPAGRPARRRRRLPAGVRDQPGRLLAAAGARLRAPLRRRSRGWWGDRRRPGLERNLPAQLQTLLKAGDKAAFNAAMSSAAAVAEPEIERTIAFRAKPYGLTDTVRPVHRGEQVQAL